MSVLDTLLAYGWLGVRAICTTLVLFGLLAFATWLIEGG